MVSAVTTLEAEATGGDGPVAAPLDGRDVLVKPVRKWRSSAIRAMREGDFDRWAETSLAEDGYQVWVDVDPDLDMVNDFFEQWAKVSGQNVGELRASPGSSKSTARRSKRT